MIVAATLDDEQVIFILASSILAAIPHPESPEEHTLVVCQAFPQGIKIKQNAAEFGMEWLIVLNAEPNFEVIEDGSTPKGSLH